MPEAGGIDLGALTRRVEQLGGFRPQSTSISQCMSPRRNWDSPQPLSRKRVCPPPLNQRVGGTLARGWGVGGVPIPTTGEKP
jgi:hypothetical protein